MSPEDFRANDNYVAALRTFLESETGLALRAVLQNEEPLDKLADRSQQYLAGGFAEEYRKFVDSIVASNKQAQVTNNTQVVGAAVESLNDSEATAVVYTNTTSTSPLSKNVPAMRYLSYRLTLRHDDAKWLVTKMSTITSLDLTPQL